MDIHTLLLRSIMRFRFLTFLFAAGMAATACVEEMASPAEIGEKTIIAVLDEETMQTRTCVSDEKGDNVGILWCSDDALGVYSETGKENAKFTTSIDGPSGEAAFSGAMALDPAYAYYPYNTTNDNSREIKGELPALQEYSYSEGALSYDYKVGVPSDKGEGYFSFNHLFALFRVTVNATGTAVQNEKLQSVTFTFADDVKIPSGSFTFPVSGGAAKWSSTSETSNELTLNWTDTPTLSSGKTFNGYLSCPPVSGLKGKELTVTLKTSNYAVSFTTTLNVDSFQTNYIYTFPLTLAKWEDKLGDDFQVESFERPSLTSLSFTAAKNPGKILGKKLFYDLNKEAGTKKGGFLNLTTITYKGATNFTTEDSQTTQTMTVDNEAYTVTGCIPYLYDRNLVPTVTMSTGAKLQYGTRNNFTDWDGESPIDFKKNNVLRVIKDGKYRDYTVNITNTGLPVVVINQPDGDTDWGNVGEKIWSKETDFDNVTPGTIAIYNADGSLDMEQAVAKTRLRGNTTMDYPKKPFAIKLDEKLEVLGMPAHKRWCLLANWKDKSLMRNHIAFYVANIFSYFMPDGIPWNPKGQFVEVVYNGVHIGNYYLCEQIKIDENRVAIQKEYSSKNGTVTDVSKFGYLLEADDNWDENTKFMTKHHLPFQFKDDGDEGNVILNHVKTKVQRIEDNLYKGYKGTASGFTDAYNDLDLASVVDQLLIYEMSMNTEFRHPKSVYMYMDGDGKLKAGPVWDFDWLSFPTLNSGYTEESDRSYTASLMSMSSMISAGRQVSSSAPNSKDDDDRKDAPFMWYPMLIKDPAFTQMAAERWEVINEYIAALAQEIYNTRDLLATSWEYNNAMWPAYYGDGNYDRQFHIGNGMCGDEKLGSFNEVCQALYTAYVARVNGMNGFVLSKQWPADKWKF